MSSLFMLRNIAGGSGGTYRLRDGKLSARAVRVLEDAPYGGWEFSGPAARVAYELWEGLQTRAHDAGVRPSSFYRSER
jgi:hypothetical protein